MEKEEPSGTQRCAWELAAAGVFSGLEVQTQRKPVRVGYRVGYWVGYQPARAARAGLSHGDWCLCRVEGSAALACVLLQLHLSRWAIGL